MLKEDLRNSEVAKSVGGRFIHVPVNADFHERLKRLAHERETSIAAITRSALLEVVEEYERKEEGWVTMK